MQGRYNDYGLVVCGGKSTRMGSDKSLLTYHDKPQRLHVYEILNGLCDKTFISCNSTQTNSIDKDYATLADLPQYSGIGPMAALLTAFTLHPQNDFLVVGCDYPFVSSGELKRFLGGLERSTLAAAFYNLEEQMYEPLLAWYSHRTTPEIRSLFEEKKYSLQYYLQRVNAQRYHPIQNTSMKSVDTPQSMAAVKALLQNTVYNVS